MSKVAEILESLSNLTLLEAAELKTQIEEKFGVSAAAPMMMAGPMPAGGGAEAAAEEKTSFDVILSDVGASKLQVVKAVKEITGKGLKEAKEVVDQAPGSEIKAGASKEEAEEIKSKIEEAGGKVELK